MGTLDNNNRANQVAKALGTLDVNKGGPGSGGERGAGGRFGGGGESGKLTARLNANSASNAGSTQAQPTNFASASHGDKIYTARQAGEGKFSVREIPKAGIGGGKTVATYDNRAHAEQHVASGKAPLQHADGSGHSANKQGK
jgi:hypothetical protein